MSRRTAESNKAILAAWNKEQELVQEGKGTREWTPQQQQDILDKGKAYDDEGVAFQGQHMKSAEQYPEYQGDPGNIQFLTRAEHLEAHDGNWRNPTNWYYDPFTKEKFNFGDGPFIPCEIIQLKDPIIIEVESKQECERAVGEKIEDSEKNESENNVNSEDLHVKSRDTVLDNSNPKYDHKPKSRVKSIAKFFTGFAKKHPIITKILKIAGATTVAVGTEVAIETLKENSSRSGNGYQNDKKNYHSGKYNPYEPEDDYDEISEAEDNSEEDDDVEDSYTPNDVPAGKQRYHYKDGTTRWKDKPAYHRGGNNDD